MVLCTFFAVSSAVAHNVTWALAWAATAAGWTALYTIGPWALARRRARKNGAQR
jgi:hypothetical protein